MSELRKDPVCDEWVVIAPKRGSRPDAYAQKGQRSVPPCPFDYGNEALTPPEVYAIRKPNAPKDGPGWLVRVVPNLYAAFTPSESLVQEKEEGYLKANAVGSCEVIIHTPNHEQPTAKMGVVDFVNVVTAYKQRLKANLENGRVQFVIIFYNHGEKAGASLKHEHSQLYAISFVPQKLKREASFYEAFARQSGACYFCDLMSREKHIGKRWVCENDAFAAFTDRFARRPYELIIAPKRHSETFCEINEAEMESFAEMLLLALERLYDGLDDPSVNFFITSSPKPYAGKGFFHWHLRLFPRITIAAGFELGTGVYINVVSPEDAASFYRQGML